MKRVVCILLLGLPAPALANPSFTVGSNPYETVFAYPHDILRWPRGGVFLRIDPQTLPWQGDVTNIGRRPSESYTSTYQDVEFAPPSGYEGDPADVHSWMRVSSYAYRRRLGLGGLLTTDRGKFLLEFTNASLDMELTADGVARASESTDGATAYHLVPFHGRTEAQKDSYELKLIYANRLRGRPYGFKVQYAQRTSGKPDGFIRFARDGQTYVVPHLTWGWATTGCNHIFGYGHINADAFYLDNYTIYAGHQLDLQASFEHSGDYKTGVRYRRRTEDGDNYRWRYDDGSQFTGDYHADPHWKDRKTSRLLRAYSKARFWESGSLDAGILFFAQRVVDEKSEINKVIESDPTWRERQGQWASEMNPYLNYLFRGGYLDCGLLFEVARTSLTNSEMRWNEISHSDQRDVLWSTSPHLGWSSSWERFSKGTEWFVATGGEVGSSITVYKQLAALTRLTILRKYTWTEKQYGKSLIPEGASQFQFQRTHERNNFARETWMTGAVGLSYDFGSCRTFLTLQLPVAYLVTRKTGLADNTELLFEHEQRQMWQVQEPTSLRLFLVYSLGGPLPASRNDPL
ncbi:hypothetical protein ACFL6M_00780 [Candidatus Eisenbacteria bacterium]|uniref:Uncharacterized protein n=1 Tax=Eiseniibacteriota bacterium TaxID=2212470 RepID=A0ABV6YIE3_UNCEI